VEETFYNGEKKTVDRVMSDADAGNRSNTGLQKNKEKTLGRKRMVLEKAKAFDAQCRRQGGKGRGKNLKASSSEKRGKGAPGKDSALKEALHGYGRKGKSCVSGSSMHSLDLGSLSQVGSNHQKWEAPARFSDLLCWKEGNGRGRGKGCKRIFDRDQKKVKSITGATTCSREARKEKKLGRIKGTI